jgi:bacillopeptidase F
LKKIFFLILLSFILSGCTLSQNLKNVTSGLKNQKASPTPSVQAVLPTPSPSPEIKSQGNLELNIQSPEDGMTLATPSLTVKGTTISQAEISINNVDTKADLQGNFSGKVTLEEGENQIVVTANDAEGNWAERDLTVTYELPEK